MCKNIFEMKNTESSGKPGLRPPVRSSPAFLLAQVGGRAASQFAQRLQKIGLAPHHAGILRILSASPGITQQTLAETLGTVPSRLVVLVDELEKKGMVERRANPHDRRRYALHVTEKGASTLAEIGRIAREHSQSLLAALSSDEQQQLATFLQRIADQQGLTPGVHPGYRRIGESNEKSDSR